MNIIFHNDDFGINNATNEGVYHAFRYGVTRSTSIRTNGIAYNEAVSLLKTKMKNIGLGIHLNLTDGKTHLTPLADSHDNYKFRFFRYLLYTSLLKNQKLINNIEMELDKQFKIARKSNLPVDHVDGQDHIHLIPEVFKIICKLCNKYNIKYIRLIHEPYYLTKSIKLNILPLLNLGLYKSMLLTMLSKRCEVIAKQYDIISNDAFYGVIYTNNMGLEAIISAIENAKRNHFKTIQITSHPAIINHPKDKIYTSKFFSWYSNIEKRTIELNALISPSLKYYIKNNKIQLINFRDL